MSNEGLSLSDRQAIEDAYQRGRTDYILPTSAGSIILTNPYNPMTDPKLVDAWERGQLDASVEHRPSPL